MPQLRIVEDWTHPAQDEARHAIGVFRGKQHPDGAAQRRAPHREPCEALLIRDGEDIAAERADPVPAGFGRAGAATEAARIDRYASHHVVESVDVAREPPEGTVEPGRREHHERKPAPNELEVPSTPCD